MMEHPFGWLSVLPPVAAIVLAIATRRVLFSLLAGIFVGALVLCGWNPIAATEQMLADHLWATFLDSSKLSVFVFTMLMGVMVGVVNRAAGMKGLVQVVTPLASNRRRGQLATWFLGLFVFFDDYANTMLLGNTLRPLTDKLKVSREKLAFLVDSTAAPVSGLALISTWVAGEIGYVSDGLSKLPEGVDWKPFEMFIASIPYRFYVLWALIFVPMIAIMARDYGPMRAAERRAIKGDPVGGTGKSSLHVDPTAPEEATPARWYNAVIPVLVTVFATVWFLYSSGDASIRGDDSVEWSLMEVFGNADSYGSLLWGALSGAVAAYVLILPQRLVPIPELVTAGGNGALKMLPALAILWFASALSNMTGNDGNADDSGAIEAASSVATALRRNDVSVEDISRDLFEGGMSIESATAALISLGDMDPPAQVSFTKSELSAALLAGGYDEESIDSMLATVAVANVDADDDESGMVTEVAYPNQGYRLYTGVFLSGLVGDSLAPMWMPTIVFVLSAFVAFSTGTSWGTMGIVMPLVIPLVYSGLATGDASVSASNPIMLGSIGGVLAGAIFGDHCSPISDTTVLSSQASGCDHVAHVRTQLPYAMTIAVISIVAGTIPIGFGFPVWLTMPIGIGLMLAAIFCFGKRIDDSDAE